MTGTFGMKNTEPKKENICAVVVTYHPEPDLPVRLTTLTKQVGAAVIIDNHSNDKAVAMLREISKQPDVHVVFNNENLGIASALNEGVMWAKERGYQWVLAMDQDTTPLDTLVEGLVAVYKDCSFRERIGMIGSNYIDPNTGGICKQPGLLWKKESFVITSGSIMPVQAFEEIGPYRDDFFIDQVDHEYCLRLQRCGYEVLFSFHIGMSHPVGKIGVHRLLWKQYKTTNHKAFRRYYRMRNKTVVKREYSSKLRDSVWRYARKDAFRILLFEDHKFLKIGAIVLGIMDGLRGKMGKLETNGFLKSKLSLGH